MKKLIIVLIGTLSIASCNKKDFTTGNEIPNNKKSYKQVIIDIKKTDYTTLAGAFNYVKNNNNRANSNNLI